jgi:hypothetical protein
VVLVLDISGSMGEEYSGTQRRIDIAASAAKSVVAGLTFTDYFTIIAFNDRLVSTLSSGLLQANDSSIALANAYLSSR